MDRMFNDTLRHAQDAPNNDSLIGQMTSMPAALRRCYNAFGHVSASSIARAFEPMLNVANATRNGPVSTNAANSTNGHTHH